MRKEFAYCIDFYCCRAGFTTLNTVWMICFTINIIFMCFIKDINECDSSPCSNGGSCVDLINGYLCNCLAAYSGKTCQNCRLFCGIIILIAYCHQLIYQLITI